MARANDFELLIVRHGDAEPWSNDGDEGRALTEEGARAIARTSAAYMHFDWVWSRALVSPLTRAQQTASILYDACAPWVERAHEVELPAPVTEPLLVPGALVEATARAVVRAGSALAGPRPKLAVFGHNPNLSALSSLLLGGAQISLGCGDMVHLFVPAPSPFDTILDPRGEDEPLPEAILLGFYPRSALELIGQGAADKG